MLITFVYDVFMIQSVKEPLVFQLNVQRGFENCCFCLDACSIVQVIKSQEVDCSSGRCF